jgi:hypothetical protein
MHGAKNKIIYFQFDGKNIQCSTRNFLSPKQASEVRTKRLLVLLPTVAMKRSFWRYQNTTRPLRGWNTHRNETPNVSTACTMVASLCTSIETFEGRTARYVLSSNSLQLTERSIPQDTQCGWHFVPGDKRNTTHTFTTVHPRTEGRMLRQNVKIMGTTCNRLRNLSQLLAQSRADEPL